MEHHSQGGLNFHLNTCRTWRYDILNRVGSQELIYRTFPYFPFHLFIECFLLHHMNGSVLLDTIQTPRLPERAGVDCTAFMYAVGLCVLQHAYFNGADFCHFFFSHSKDQCRQQRLQLRWLSRTRRL